ncbi:arabinofuranosidase catalytic domain-containing protein [Paludibaculum fermentans]|uniref:arabinofuranosidase catalytic domain-containing protein n=1 Tax=Paludibaculum fermentans TaxID=1473598 RepID=UPI003EBAD7A8
MKMRILGVLIPVLALALAGATPPRLQGPCDIYGAAGTPCVAAHSTTRALYAAYSGPLYQVKRASDGKTLDIGILPPTASPIADSGGVADAAAQDAFCTNTLCVINRIYDQSGKGNHLLQSPPGPLFPGPAKGGFDTQPIADMAPITIGGHKAYGVYIMPGMGFRNNDARDLAINDEPEGIYYVIDGTHYDSGCCFDYGNSSTNGRAVGTGTMETTYFGTATAWGSGDGPGPWIMADLEAGLFSGYNAKQNPGDPTIDSWRFVTAVVDGGGGNKWDLRGGNAQKGGLTTFYSGIRPGSRTNSSYYPMHKQGAILLGIGGDNGNGSAGTFYEGVMTTGYPTEATTDEVQANVVAARYDVQRVSLSRVTTFTPGSTQNVTATFTNVSEVPATGVKLSLSVPAGWTARVSGSVSKTFDAPVAPGASVSAAFQVTSPSKTGAGFLTGRAEWSIPTAGRKQFDAIPARVRNVLPVKINEVRLGTTTNTTDQFIELYNAGSSAADLSNWTLVNTQSQWAGVKLATIPTGTRLESGAYYLLGLSGSGLAAPATVGATTVQVRSIIGLAPGEKVDIDGEIRTIAKMGTAAAALTTVFEPVSTGPWLTVPAGSTNLPVTNAAGFSVGEKIGIDIGGNYELATVTAVGQAATQTTLSAASAAGATNIKVAASDNVRPGDTLTIGTGGRKEIATVKSAGSSGASGAGIDLAAPLKFDHAAGIDVSDVGTGISFTPATRFPHVSGDAVQALGSGLTLDRPLARSHEYGAAVVNTQAATVGYQGPPAPNQWFGGTLSARAGSIALLDAAGAVVDAMVYGSQQSSSSGNGTITSPELATLEGDQGKGGCIVVVPLPIGGAGRSRGRFPNGADADSNCTDFQTQASAFLPLGASAGATNIKVGNMTGFTPGQKILIDTGANLETAVIATVGTAGASTVRTDTSTGATVLPVASGMGFSAGQTITVDSGAKQETAVIASTAFGRGGGTITVSVPLTATHSAGAQVSGSGISLTAPLSKTHAGGAQIASGVPTPGAPNQF